MRARLDLNRERRVIRMARAMLIMDMPSMCVNCNLCRPTREKHTGESCWECMARPMIMITSKEARTTKPTWCPLREVPQKKEYVNWEQSIDRFKKVGYNACIDEILGGGE